MKGRNASLLLILMSVVMGTSIADELNISADQLDNLGVAFGLPQVADLADDFQAPARVIVPPTNDFAVVPFFSGTIKKLGVSAGDTVRKGEPIAWIASQEFLATQSEYLDALHQLELGQIRFSNDETLNQEGIVSTRRLSESKHELEEFRLAEQRLRQFLSLAGVSSAGIDSLHDSLRLQAEMILRAPIDGVVLEAYSTAGQQIDSSQAVYRIAALDTLWLEIDVPFTKSTGVVPGVVVLVRQGDASVSASVTNTGRHVDENNQTVIVRAEIENNSGLAPGQFVTATLTKGGGNAYFLLPGGSVVRKDNKDYVFVRKAEGVEARAIEVVRQAQGRIIVGEGIEPGESVAIRGTAALKARWLGMGGGE